LNNREFLKPSILKIIITLLIPVPIHFIFTGSIFTVLDFYWYLFTPTIKVYADVKYREFNQFILLWVPFYLAACFIEARYRRTLSS